MLFNYKGWNPHLLKSSSDLEPVLSSTDCDNWAIGPVLRVMKWLTYQNMRILFNFPPPLFSYLRPTHRISMIHTLISTDRFVIFQVIQRHEQSESFPSSRFRIHRGQCKYAPPFGYRGRECEARRYTPGYLSWGGFEIIVRTEFELCNRPRLNIGGEILQDLFPAIQSTQIPSEYQKISKPTVGMKERCSFCSIFLSNWAGELGQPGGCYLL